MSEKAIIESMIRMADGLAEAVNLSSMTYSEAISTLNIAVLRNFPGYTEARQEKIIHRIEKNFNKKIDDLVEHIFEDENDLKNIEKSENLINSIELFLSGRDIMASSTGDGLMIAAVQNDPTRIRIQPIFNQSGIWFHIDDMKTNLSYLLKETRLGMKISDHSKKEVLEKSIYSSSISYHGNSKNIQVTKSGYITTTIGPFRDDDKSIIDIGNTIYRQAMIIISARDACIFSINEMKPLSDLHFYTDQTEGFDILYPEI